MTSSAHRGEHLTTPTRAEVPEPGPDGRRVKKYVYSRIRKSTVLIDRNLSVLSISVKE